MTRSTFMRLDGDRSRLAAGVGAGCGSRHRLRRTGHAGTTGAAGSRAPASGATGDAGTQAAAERRSAGTAARRHDAARRPRRHQRQRRPRRQHRHAVAAAAPVAPARRRRRQTRVAADARAAPTGTAGTSARAARRCPARAAARRPRRPRETTYMIDVSGTSRSYIVTLPANYNASQPHQLVFAWHGRTGTAMQIARQLLRPQVAHDERDLRRRPGPRHDHRSDRHRLAQHQRAGHRVRARRRWPG